MHPVKSPTKIYHPEYYGDVENGKRHGQGTYTWTTGDKFKGKWEAGIRNGVGFLKYTKGTKYEGQWKNDEPEVHLCMRGESLGAMGS